MRSSYCGINREDISLDIGSSEVDAVQKKMGWSYRYPRHLLQTSRLYQQDGRQTPKQGSIADQLSRDSLAETCLSSVETALIVETNRMSALDLREILYGSVDRLSLAKTGKERD